MKKENLEAGKDYEQVIAYKCKDCGMLFDDFNSSHNCGGAGKEAIAFASDNFCSTFKKNSNPPTPNKSGIELIAAECKRQIEVEKWDYSRDADYGNGELIGAAACYAVNALNKDGINSRVQIYRDAELDPLGRGWYDAWPWDEQWDKRQKHDKQRSLVIAGALIAAELDRLNGKAGYAAAQKSEQLTPVADNCEANHLDINELLKEFKRCGFNTENWDGDEGAEKAIVAGVCSYLEERQEKLFDTITEQHIEINKLKDEGIGDEDGWINVYKKLPEFDDEYNVAWEINDGGSELVTTTMEFQVENKRWIDVINGDYDVTNSVRYWRELPEPPPKKGIVSPPRGPNTECA